VELAKVQKNMVALKRSFLIPTLTLAAQDPDALALDPSVPDPVYQFYRLKQREDTLKLELIELGEDAGSPHVQRNVKYRERKRDQKKHSERAEFEDGLRSELWTIQKWLEEGSVSTVEDLRGRFPEFRLWKILPKVEQDDLLNSEFKPRTYARTLTARKFGVGPEAIKKSRQLLKRLRPAHSD